MKEFLNGRAFLILLMGIILWFSALVFQHIGNQGMLYHDVGVNLLEAKFLSEGAEVLFQSAGHVGNKNGAGFFQEMKETTTGVPPFLAKPAFNSALWAGSFFMGFQDSLASEVTATFAILNILLVFLIGRKLFHSLAGLIAAAMLASSFLFFIYARSGLADQVVTVFFLLAILFYLDSWSGSSLKKLVCVGFFLGVAFTTNQLRTLYMPMLLIGFDFMLGISGRFNLSTWIKRVLLIGAGFVLPVILFELPYGIARLAVGPLPFPDYWGQIAYVLRATSGNLQWFQSPWEMTQCVFAMEGPFFPSAVMMGWIYLIWRCVQQKKPHAGFCVLFSLVPYAYFSGMSWGLEILPRMVLTSLPFAALCAGKFLSDGLEHFFERFQTAKKYFWVVLSAGILILLAGAYPRIAAKGITRSGYREASHFLKKTGEKKLMILALEPIWRLHLGRVAYDPLNRPETARALVRKSRENGIHYVVVDHSTIYSKYGQEYTASFIGKVQPVVEFDNPLGNSAAYLMDSYGVRNAFEMARDPRCGKIYIFRVQDLEKSLSL